MMDSVVQLVRLKWLLGQILALLSLWTVAALDLARGPVWFGVLALVIVVTLFPSLPGKISKTSRKWLAPILILFFVGDLVMSGRDFVPPLVRVLLILLAVRAVAVRRTREDLQLVLLTMFLAVVSGVFTLSMLFAVQALLFSLITIGLLFVANLLESSGEADSADGEWDQFRWGRFFGVIRDSMSLRMFRSMVLLFGLLVATTGVLFVSIPRVHLEQAIPFLSLPQQGLSGFSDVVRLGDVTSIQEDDSVALRVDVPGIEAIPGDPYWRMLILDRYAAGAFVNSLFLSDSSGREPPRVHDISPFPARWFSGENRSAGAWTFYLERNVSRYLPILGPFREMTFQGDQRLEANPDVLVFRIPNTNSSVFSYRVRDFLVEGETPASRIDQPLIRGNSPQGEGEDERYPFTTLEVSVEPEEEEFLKELVAKILNGPEVSAQEEGEKILNYLRANHTYTLSPGSFAEGDPIVQWLREGRPGHCEFFAGAFTLLARTAGIPARMVVGFSGGSWNSFENFFVVRNRNAHAWSEILVGESWVRFDPTPGGGSGSSGAAATTGGVQFARDSDFRAWVDSLRIMWYRRVINFDDDSQQEMIEGVSGFAQSVWNQVKESLLDGWEGLKSFGRSVLDSALQTVGVVVGVLLVLTLAWIPFRRLGLRWRIFGKIGKLHPIRRRAGIELRRLEDSGIRTDGGEEQFERLRANLLEVRFGRVLELTEATRLFREVRRFRRGKSG